METATSVISWLVFNAIVLTICCVIWFVIFMIGYLIAGPIGGIVLLGFCWVVGAIRRAGRAR